MVMELTDVVAQQKTALNGLRCERDSLKAQVASHDPTELRRLREAVASLSERAGELSAMKVFLEVINYKEIFAIVMFTFNGRHCSGHGLPCPQADPYKAMSRHHLSCLPWAACLELSLRPQSLPGLSQHENDAP